MSFPTASVYDVDNTLLSTLPLADGIQWQRQPNVPGWLSMRLPLKDSATALATGGRFLKVFWRGQCVQAAKIGHSTVELGEDGNLWRVFDQQVGVADLLSGMVVLPEHGMDRISTQGQRWFGWMSGPGAWRATGNWTTSEATTWATMTGSRTGKPEGLDFPNPSWIAKNDPLHSEAIGQLQFSYLDFTTATDFPYQILATGDNWLWLALDGEILITPDAQDGQTWRFLVQVTGTLPPGDHTIAGKVLNGGLTAPSPMGLLVTLQEMQSNGDVVPVAPVVNSDASWVTSDIVPGFKRADVLAQVFAEAVARGARGTTLLTLGYTFTDDSYGDAWLDTPGEYALDVNSTILDAVTVLTDDDLDVDVDPDTFEINAYNRLGHDLYSTVKLDLGRDNGGIDEHHVDRVEPKFNTAYVQIADGRFVEVSDTASVTAYGVIEAGLSLGTVADKATAERLAAVQFKENAHPSLTFTTKLSSLTGPQLYVDFNVGDSIGVPDEAGTGYVKVRVVSVTVDATGEVPVITPELVLDPS